MHVRSKPSTPSDCSCTMAQSGCTCAVDQALRAVSNHYSPGEGVRHLTHLFLAHSIHSGTTFAALMDGLSNRSERVWGSLVRQLVARASQAPFTNVKLYQCAHIVRARAGLPQHHTHLWPVRTACGLHMYHVAYLSTKRICGLYK
eukprot:1157417-Pelagomonas_calceolata.AAC.2